MKKTKIIFILAAICIIITGICIFTWSNYQNEADKYVWSKDYSDDYKYDVDKQMIEREYNQGRISYSEYQDKLSKINAQTDKRNENINQNHADKMLVICYCMGVVTVILFAIGIVLKVKEKKNK